jgi:hypothetical protein
MMLVVVLDDGSNIGTLTLPDGSDIPSVGDFVFVASGLPVYLVLYRFYTHTATNPDNIKVILQCRKVADTTGVYGL